MTLLIDPLFSERHNSHSLSVIIPTRNEAETIEETLIRLKAALPFAEVWVIDGGQEDRTREKVLNLQADWSNLNYFKNIEDCGKGHAIKKGIELATRPLISQLDSDLQFWPEDLVLLLDSLIAQNADFVCGSRFLPHSKRQSQSVPGFRPMGNKAINLYASLLTGFYFTDLLAGIKIWKSEVTKAFRLQSNDFCYEAELPIKALRCGYRVIESPVRTEPRLHGKSSVNEIAVGFALLKKIPQFRWQDIGVKA